MKSLKIIIIYIVFITLVIESAYLYSIRWNLVPWGSSQRDGLFFLAFYTIVLPLLILAAIIKRYFLRHRGSIFIRYSFFVYLLLIGLPAIDTFGSQIALGLGVSICLIICGCIFVEIIKYKNQILR